MLAMKQKLVLMAPTGRAAKVFSNYSGTSAFTIHRRIYRQKNAGDLSAFSLGFNAAQDTLFIVDEASMIANADTPLLDDLIRFVYNYKNCRLLLIGDRAQLPPVGEEESPALMADVLRGYGMKVYEADLNEVLRQAEDSGILWNATEVRCMMADGIYDLPKIRFEGFLDIVSVPGDELIESLATSFSRVGMDETLVVTRSNKRANIYNQGIRNTVLDREDELCRGDRIMIVKNNYYWVKSEGIEGNISFIANGDIAVVQRVRNVHELYGFRFAEVTMTFPDYDDYELTAITLLDTLTTEAPALTREQQEQLYTQVMEDYMDVPYKSERLKKLKDDKYYNALQIKFAYAATCHKAQGGQWAHVYIDQGYMTDDMLTPDYFHWLYTALTRATEQVFLVNWPKTQVENPSDSY
jgi:ATP-dependent exoDNAse (exonuclease V) alpha subunit